MVTSYECLVRDGNGGSRNLEREVPSLRNFCLATPILTAYGPPNNIVTDLFNSLMTRRISSGSRGLREFEPPPIHPSAKYVVR